MLPLRVRGRTAPRIVLILALVVCGGGVALALSGLSARGEPTRPPDAEASGRPRSERARPGRARAPAADGASNRSAGDARRPRPEIDWRDSVPVGLPTGGELVRGVRLPRQGRHFFTWDPVERTSPNRPWRRWGTDDAVRTTLRVLAEHRRAFPRAPRIGVGDLSRPHGGDFGIAYGPIGHSSHENGLDVDVYYPLEDGKERAPLSVDQVDLGLSQALVDRFVGAGAERVFVGPSTGLTGPPSVVQAIPNHDNHLHVRFPADR